MSAECSKHGTDIVYPAGTWPIGVCPVCEAESERATLVEIAEAAKTLTSEWCRECREEPAEFILWGKLFPPEALGPRCYTCARKHVPAQGLGDPSWAIANLGPVQRLLARWLEPQSQEAAEA